MAGEFTEAEQKYFESGGESELPVEEAAPVEVVEEVAEEPVYEAESPVEDSSGTVPHAALHQERERRKEVQQQLEALKAQSQQSSVLEARLNQLEALAKEPEVELPSYDEDPAENLNARLMAQENAMAQSQQSEQQQRAEQEFMGNYRSQAQQFATNQKDFGEAYNYAQSKRVEVYKVLGYTDQEVAGMVNQDERAFVYKAMQDGVNPAERIYALAKSQGYSAEAQPAGESSIETIERGQAQKSLGSNGGAPKRTTLESLASMSDDDFAEATKDGKWKSFWN